MADCIYCDLKEVLENCAAEAREAGNQIALAQIKFRQMVLEEMGKLRFDLIYPLIEEYIAARRESEEPPRAVEYELDMRGPEATLIKLNEGPR